MRNRNCVALNSRIGSCVLVAAMVSHCAIGIAQEPAGPVVAVTGGKVQGRLLSEPVEAVFKGIPFAQPPVGDLRWREPQPVKAWTDVRSAADFGNTCAQADSGWNKIAAQKGSEDCLYLNVWTPEWPAKTKHPVMVWIHGGGNTGGSALGAGGVEPPFDGASLASHGVLVVTLNYRLGLLGFIGHPELTAESPHHASGAYGLMDQIAALKWVHDNISKFGGDPANVTLFGQSAGAQNTSILVASPLTKGLIQKAIAQSGTPMIGDKRLQTPAQTEQLGVILGAALKAPATGTVAYLRKIPTADILAALAGMRKEMTAQGLILDVGMDGYVIPQFSPEVYRSGKEAAIPMIFGSNGRDNPGAGRTGSPSDTPEQRRATLKVRIEGFYAKYPKLAEAALKVYGFSDGPSEVSTYSPYGPVDMQYGVDVVMRCEADVISAWHSAIAPTYQYEFNAGTAAHPPVHSAELDFVFGYLRDQAADATLGKLSEQMQLYWTNFAKTSDPNGPGLPKWEKFNSKSQDYVEFSNNGVSAKAALRSVPCAVYAEKLNLDLDGRKQK